MEEGRGRVGAWVWLLPLISFFALIWLLAIDFNSHYYEAYGFGIPMVTARSGVIGLYVVFIVIITISYITKAVGGEEGEVQMAEVVGGGVAEASEGEGGGIVVEEVKEKTLEYPPKISGAIYGDVYVDVGDDTKLLVRTVLARLCVLCDNQHACWEKVKGKISWEDFINNTECKVGLRKMLSKQ